MKINAKEVLKTIRTAKSKGLNWERWKLLAMRELGIPSTKIDEAYLLVCELIQQLFLMKQISGERYLELFQVIQFADNGRDVYDNCTRSMLQFSK
jgi:hypothetical protein